MLHLLQPCIGLGFYEEIQIIFGTVCLGGPIDFLFALPIQISRSELITLFWIQTLFYEEEVKEVILTLVLEDICCLKFIKSTHFHDVVFTSSDFYTLL